MKFKNDVQLKWGLVLAVIFLSWTNDLISQQTIVFKNGREERARVLYQNQDTLKYHISREKYVVHTVLLDSVDRFGIRTPGRMPEWDTIPRRLRSPGISWHQIRFKNSSEEKALILYMHPDTLKYLAESDRMLVRTVLLDQVDCFGIKSTAKNHTWDTNYFYKGYKHYKHARNVGIILTTAGAAIAIPGIMIIANAEHTHDEFWGDTYDTQVVFGAFVTTIGGGLILAGTILTITSIHKIEMFRNKLNGFSFDFQYAPGYREVSMVYRF